MLFLGVFCACQRVQRRRAELILAVTDGPVANHQTDRDQNWHTHAYSSGNGHELIQINPLIPEGHGEGLGGHQFIYLGKLPNHWTDRDNIWHTFTDSPGNRHRLNKFTPRAPRGIWRGSGCHKLKNVGKMPNSCTDREHIWHTYAYSSGNGHELKINPLIPEGHGG